MYYFNIFSLLEVMAPQTMVGKEKEEQTEKLNENKKKKVK